MSGTTTAAEELSAAVWEARRHFPHDGIGAGLGVRAGEHVAAASPDGLQDAMDEARDAGSFAWSALSGGHALRDASLDGWFALEAATIPDMAAMQRARRSEWQAARAALTEEQTDAEDAEEEDREAEEARIDRLEDDGAYGRTLRWTEETDRWIYVRFGRIPAEGRSVFGLPGEDNEDGPDQWRVEAGNRTHEDGICVLRATRHPGVPGALVLQEPTVSLAMYGVPPFEDYLHSIIPQYEEGEHPTVLRIDGAVVSALARDGTRRVRLGSDGEYMIDPSVPHLVHPLSLDEVWVSPSTSVREFLTARRGYAAPEPAKTP